MIPLLHMQAESSSMQHTLEQDGKLKLLSAISLGVTIHTDFCVKFQIQICEHMPQNGKSDCFVHMLQGELLVACCSSPYPLGGWDVAYFYFQIFMFWNRCVFSLRKCTAFSLKINAHKHFKTLRLDFKYFGLHSFLIINNYYNCKMLASISVIVGKDSSFCLNFGRAVNSSYQPQKSHSPQEHFRSRKKGGKKIKVLEPIFLIIGSSVSK